jgi:hypothetical protein
MMMAVGLKCFFAKGAISSNPVFFGVMGPKFALFLVDKNGSSIGQILILLFNIYKFDFLFLQSYWSLT